MQIQFLLIEAAIDRLDDEKFLQWCKNDYIRHTKDYFEYWDKPDALRDRFERLGRKDGLSVENYLAQIALKAAKDLKKKIEITVSNFSGRYREILINWLIKRIMKIDIAEEDYGFSDSKASEYFADFIKYSPRFKEGQSKDINTYTDLSAIYMAFKPHKEMEAMKTRRDPKTVPDSKIIYEDETCLIMSPLTPEASCELGAGTEWCTAKYKPDDDRNAFSYYNKQGPLYIIFDKEIGKRFQWHQKTGQFMDEDDVSSTRLGHYYPKLVQSLTEEPTNKTKWLTDDVLQLLRVWFLEDRIPNDQQQTIYDTYSNILDRLEQTEEATIPKLSQEKQLTIIANIKYYSRDSYWRESTLRILYSFIYNELHNSAFRIQK